MIETSIINKYQRRLRRRKQGGSHAHLLLLFVGSIVPISHLFCAVLCVLDKEEEDHHHHHHLAALHTNNSKKKEKKKD
jgi:hypothetical protein